GDEERLLRGIVVPADLLGQELEREFLVVHLHREKTELLEQPSLALELPRVVLLLNTLVQVARDLFPALDALGNRPAGREAAQFHYLLENLVGRLQQVGSARVLPGRGRSGENERRQRGQPDAPPIFQLQTIPAQWLIHGQRAALRGHISF